MREVAVFDDDGSRRRVTETLRQARPELVLTASPVDYHCDHEAAGAPVRDPRFAAPAPDYGTPTEAPAGPPGGIPRLCGFGAGGGEECDSPAGRPGCRLDSRL